MTLSLDKLNGRALQKLKYEIHTKIGMNWRPLESYLGNTAPRERLPKKTKGNAVLATEGTPDSLVVTSRGVSVIKVSGRENGLWMHLAKRSPGLYRGAWHWKRI